MNPSEINQAIAQALGHKVEMFTPAAEMGGDWKMICPDPFLRYRDEKGMWMPVPNYHGDLNAIAGSGSDGLWKFRFTLKTAYRLPKCPAMKNNSAESGESLTAAGGDLVSSCA